MAITKTSKSVIKQLYWGKKATGELFRKLCMPPGHGDTAILCGEAGLAKKWSPLRRSVDCHLAEAAGGLNTAFALRGPTPRPKRRGHGREPNWDGGHIKVIEEGSVRRGRSTGGEHRVGVDVRQPLPTPIVGGSIRRCWGTIFG